MQTSGTTDSKAFAALHWHLPCMLIILSPIKAQLCVHLLIRKHCNVAPPVHKGGVLLGL